MSSRYPRMVRLVETTARPRVILATEDTATVYHISERTYSAILNAPLTGSEIFRLCAVDEAAYKVELDEGRQRDK